MSKIEVYGVALNRVGDRLKVDLEIEPGRWLTVIKEDISGGPISHIVEPSGIRRAFLRDKIRKDIDLPFEVGSIA